MNTYTAKCQRAGDWWAITVPQIDGVHTQARRIDQVEAMARDAIALMLDVDPGSFDVEVEPELPAAAIAARAARTAARKAEEDAEAQTRKAIATLQHMGLTVRDIGALVGISAQRVSQLAGTKEENVVTSRKVPVAGGTRDHKVVKPKPLRSRRKAHGGRELQDR